MTPKKSDRPSTNLKIIELSKVPREQKGQYKRGGAPEPAPHEKSTIRFLLECGFDIELISPSNIYRSKNPDMLLSGSVWEMKSPTGSGRRTIESQFHGAGKQADNLVLDLRRIGIPDKKSKDKAIFEFTKSRGIKQLILITKSRKIFKIKK